MNTDTVFLSLLINEFRRRVFDESFHRIEKCLSQLSEEETWKRPNENTVSVGNLVLHLCGNARQWMVSGLGGEADIRKRSLEFSEKSIVSQKELLQMLRSLREDINNVLEKLSVQDILSVKKVQGFSETGVSIIIHVIEHFSYHTGQITLHTKMLKNIDTGYYKGVQLEH